MYLYTGQMFKSSVFMESFDCYFSSSRLQKTDPVLKFFAFRDERRPLKNSLRALYCHSEILICDQIGGTN